MPRLVDLLASLGYHAGRRYVNEELLRNLLILLVLILGVIVLAPYFVNPFTIEQFKTNFNIILLLKPFCQLKPNQCAKLLDPNYGDTDILRRKAFQYYDLIYVRHRSVDAWDQFVLKIVRFLIPMKMILWIRLFVAGPVENFNEYTTKLDESLEVMLAIGNSMLLHTIKGVLVSRMWVFFIFGTVVTICESWVSLVEPIYNVLRRDVNVF